MKSEGSDNEEDWDPVVVLASLKNAKLHEKAALELENAKREVLEGIGIGKDKKDKEEASPEDKDNEVTATVEGCEADIALILDSLANAMLDEKTASELKKAKTRSLKDEGSSSDIHGRNDESGQKQRYLTRERSPPPPTQFMGRSRLDTISNSKSMENYLNPSILPYDGRTTSAVASSWLDTVLHSWDRRFKSYFCMFHFLVESLGFFKF
ncbi:hypothetical protein GOBAR_DD17208 [Gossypium barbadense]|nr:hypothetical protein GOBAR_DD17208 [Gossypium barbadense]